MPPLIGALAYTAVVLAIFYFDRENIRTSKALWIPILWLMINGSRPVTLWFHSGPSTMADTVDANPIDAAIFGALELAAVVVLVQRRRQVVEFAKRNPLLVAFLGYCLLSVIWSDYTFISLKRWVKAFGDYGMVLIVLTERDPVTAIRRFLCRVGYVLIPASIVLIKYYPNLGREYDPWTFVPMYCGVTLFKNLLGMITLVCTLGLVWAFARTLRDRNTPRRRQHLIAQAVMLLMSLWIFKIANSMTSLSCFLFAGVILFVASQPKTRRRPAILHLLIAGAVGLSIIALFFDSGGGLVSMVGRNPTLTGRTAIWKIVIKLASAHPLLGTGYETFWMGERLQTMWRFEKGIQEAHDGYLEVYANLGLVGVALLGGVIVSGYRNAFASYRLHPDLGSIKIAFFVVGVIYSLTEAGFRMMSPVWIAFLLAVMYVPPSLLERKRVRLSTRVTTRSRKTYADLITTYKEDF